MGSKRRSPRARARAQDPARRSPRCLAHAGDGRVDELDDDAGNDETPLLLGKTVVHAPGAWASEEIQMSLPGPTAITVARVLERGLLATQIVAVGSDGSRWGIDSERGEIILIDDVSSDSLQPLGV